MSNYSNVDCMGMQEFHEDLSRIKYVKRLLKKYIRTGELRPILLLNHVMIVGNVFGRIPAARMFFHKLENETHSSLKTVLLYLDYIYDEMVFDGVSIESISLDSRLAKILKEL